MELSDGIFVVPLRGRPEGYLRLAESIEATDPEARILAVIDEDDPTFTELKKIATTAQHEVLVMTGVTSCAQKLNAAFAEFPSEGFYGFLANDIEITAENSLTLLAAAVPAFGISYGKDSIHNESLATHPVISGELLRTIGWWVPQGISHWHIDTIIMRLAQTCSRAVYVPEAEYEHHHPSKGVVPSDDINALADETKVQDFRSWEYYNKYAFNPLCDRIIQVIQGVGRLSGVDEVFGEAE